MNYLESDIIYYTTINPNFSFLNTREKSLLRYLKELDHTMWCYREILLDKPNEQYEVLDSIYILNRQLKTFSATICSDMMELSFKTASVAAFLALFAKKDEYLPYIDQAITHYKEDSFIFEFAKSIITNNTDVKYKESVEYINIIRDMLNAMNSQKIELRQLPKDANKLQDFYSQLKIQQENFKEYYHTHSIQDSLVYIRQLPLFSYIVDYKTL